MVRLAAYSDDPYVRDGAAIGAVASFALFLAALGERADAFVLLGRLDPREQSLPVALPPSVHFVALPWWEDQSRPAGLLRALPGSARRVWRVLDDTDCLMLFGPSPLGIVFAALARIRGRRLVLGVRMDFERYSAHRYPDRPAVARIARALDAIWRAIARRAPTVVVGAALAERYGAAGRLLDTTVSLVRDADVADARRPAPGSRQPIRVLSVGRLDEEKNPLLLAEVLADLRADGSDWTLDVCGDGLLRGPLAARAADLGVADSLRLRGFVGPSDGLGDLYREADMFLHVSWIEGVPQVLLEAWATGLPVVATDVGGVRAATGSDGAVLVGPGDARAAADALRRIAADESLRAALTRAGLERARSRTLEREADRVMAFVAGDGSGQAGSA